jgi:anti-sigma factor RsiW
MSPCPTLADLHALVDCDLSAPRELCLRRHLDVCVSCRRTIDAMSALKRAVARSCEREVPSFPLRYALIAARHGSRRRSPSSR